MLFNREPATDVVKAYGKARFVGITAKEARVIKVNDCGTLESDKNMTAIVTAN